MPTTIDEVYSQVAQLPPTEQLRLVERIARDLAARGPRYREDWTDDDLREARLWSLQRAARSFEEASESA